MNADEPGGKNTPPPLPTPVPLVSFTMFSVITELVMEVSCPNPSPPLAPIP